MTNFSLAKLDKARTALMESRKLEDVLAIKNLAEAAKTFAQAAHLGRESQNYAAEISLLASRKAGEILSCLQKTQKQDAAKKSPAVMTGDSEYRKTLRETGTPERTAQYWQKLADIPETVFEKYITETKEVKGEITTRGLLNAKPHPEKRKNRSEPLESADALYDLARRVVNAGYKTLRDAGEDASHLHSAKTWLLLVLDEHCVAESTVEPTTPEVSAK